MSIEVAQVGFEYSAAGGDVKLVWTKPNEAHFLDSRLLFELKSGITFNITE